MKSASAVPGIITSVYVTTGGGRTGNGGGNGTAGTQDEIDFEWKGKTLSGDLKGYRLCHQTGAWITMAYMPCVIIPSSNDALIIFQATRPRRCRPTCSCRARRTCR